MHPPQWVQSLAGVARSSSRCSSSSASESLSAAEASNPPPTPNALSRSPAPQTPSSSPKPCCSKSYAAGGLGAPAPRAGMATCQTGTFEEPPPRRPTHCRRHVSVLLPLHAFVRGVYLGTTTVSSPMYHLAIANIVAICFRRGRVILWLWSLAMSSGSGFIAGPSYHAFHDGGGLEPLLANAQSPFIAHSTSPGVACFHVLAWCIILVRSTVACCSHLLCISPLCLWLDGTACPARALQGRLALRVSAKKKHFLQFSLICQPFIYPVFCA